MSSQPAMLALELTPIDNTQTNLADNLHDLLANALERASEAALQLLEEAAKGGAPTATGTLRDAIFHQSRGRPEFGGIVSVYPPADVYAAPVEYGSSLHMPPIAALSNWVRMRFGLQDERAVRSAAWAVAKTIRKRGTAAHRMFQNAVDTTQAEVQAIFDREIESALAAAQWR